MPSDESCSTSTDSGHCTETGDVNSSTADKLRLTIQELADKGFKLVKKVNMLMDNQRQADLNCGNDQRSKKHNPSEKKQQPMLSPKPNLTTDNKVKIQIKDKDIFKIISPRPSLSKKSASFSHRMHASRISTDSQGTVRVPVPFICSGSDSFQVML